MDIGGDLRRARTWRQLTLDDIARRTKITLTILRAMESNRFDQVPGGLFARSFLRAYAREVSIDPEPLIERYRAEFEDVQPVVAEAPHDAAALADHDRDRVPLEDEGHGPAHTIGLAIVLLIGVGYFGYARGIVHSDEAASKPADVTSAAVTGAVPVATTGSLAPPAAPQNNGRLSFEIRATSDCWVAASADGERLVSRILAAGERQQFDVHDVVMIRVGDPGAFVFTINGVAGKPLGSAGVPVSVQITRDNYKTFLASKSS